VWCGSWRGVDRRPAQVLGTFSWQLAPYCNVLTMTVEQRGATYRLDGTDDLCGAQVHAAASGTAHLNPNSTVSVAVTVTRPDGIPVQHNLSLVLPTLWCQPTSPSLSRLTCHSRSRLMVLRAQRACR
jgi:hypothetical protein